MLSLYNVQNTDKLEATRSVPRIGRSEKLETYDVNKDEKFAYLMELMRLEKSGIDILKLMEKSQKKRNLDVKV